MVFMGLFGTVPRQRSVIGAEQGWCRPTARTAMWAVACGNKLEPAAFLCAAPASHEAKICPLAHGTMAKPFKQSLFA